MANALFNRRIITNSLHLILEKGLKLGLGLFVGVYVIRYLGPDRYGTLSYVLSLAGLFIPLASLGYSTVAVKEVVNEPALQNQILGSVLGLNGIGAAVIFLIINGIAWWLSGAESLLLHVVSLRVLFSPASTVDVYFQSIVKARYPVLARSTGQLLSAGLRLLAVFLGVGLLWFVVIQSAVAFVVGALLVFAYTKYGTGPIRDWNWDTSTARRVALLSLPLLLTNLFNVVILRVDQVIIHQLLDEGETGVYAAAATLSEAWYFLPGAFLTSLFPLLVRTRKESETAYEEQLTILCSVFFYLALGIAVIFYFTADWIVPLLLGEAYARSSAILVVHAWAGAFVFLGRPVTKALIIADLNGYYLVMRLLAAGVNVGLNYLLIPSYGIIGAAWATLVAYAVAHVFSYALFPATRPYFRIQLRAIGKPFRWLRATGTKKA